MGWVSGFGDLRFVLRILMYRFGSQDLDLWVWVSGFGSLGLCVRIWIYGFGY